MFGLFKKTPKLEARFEPRIAVGRELAREVQVAGELTLHNTGRDAELTDLELVLIAGGTRRIDLVLPDAWRGRVRVPGGGELREKVDWTVKLAAPMRASSAEIQVNTTEGGKRRPLAMTPPFPLGNE
ncbi:MAG: hypothetical protein E6J55_21745 [Deltaproteobacteria bacterium]|nr:MAG: hypothetical protein E6J55_21745 [Deltaproteobacteria bacterium]